MNVHPAEPTPNPAGSGLRTSLRAPGVQARISIVFVGFALLLIAVMQVTQQLQQRQVESLFRERAAEADQSFARILDLRGRTARVHAKDYARWDEFVDFVHTRDATWVDVNVTQSIATFGLDVAWVLDARKRILFAGGPTEIAGLRELPVPLTALGFALTGNPDRHFFAATPHGLLEVWTNSIVPSADIEHLTTPAGYYVIGQLWTPARIAELARFAGGRVKIDPPGGDRAERAVGKSGLISVRTELAGIDGRPVATLVFTSNYEVGRQVDVAMGRAILLVVAGTVLALLLLWWAVTHWVGQPLRAITRAMEQEEPEPLEPVLSRHDEMGKVARLVRAFLAQRHDLIEARLAAEAAARAEATFLANISHELRTPMHGILSFARFGMRDAQTASRDDLHDDFRQVNECGESLLTLLNALLDLSRLEAGRMNFAFSDVSVPDVVDVAMDEFRSLYHERQIRLSAVIEPGLPGVVADRMRLLQVLRNLISNAAKFTPPDGCVVVHVTSCGTLQRITVEDTGQGHSGG